MDSGPSIIQEILHDREAGATRLVAECRDSLYAAALSLCGDPAQAEDLVFRTFERVLDRVATCRDESAFEAWMKAIMRNEWLMSVRRATVGNTVLAGTPSDVEKFAEPGDGADSIAAEVDASILRDAIEELPDAMREAVVLRYLMGLPLAKAAKILAVPVGTVNSRLHYARQILAAKLGAAAKNPKGKALLVALALGALTAVGAAVATVAAIVGEARSTPPALSEGTPLSEGGYAAQDSSPLQEGAVAEGDWGSTATDTSTSPTTGDNMNATKAARTFAAATLALTSGFATVSPAEAAPASLPAGYCQCSYIESTGTQYIDTEFKPDVNTRADYHFYMYEFRDVSSYVAPFGSRNGNNYQFFAGAARASNRDDWFRRFSNINNDNTSANTGKPPVVGEHFFSLNGATYTLDDYTYTFTGYAAFAKTYNAYVFAVNNNNVASQHAPIKLYSLKIWDDGTLARDFVPCIDQNGKPGLYDTVNGLMYYNKAGGADFRFEIMAEASSLTLSCARTNGVWYATVDLQQGTGEVNLNVVSPQGATNVVALSNGVATAPATFTAAIPGLAARTTYSLSATCVSGTDTISTTAVPIFNFPELPTTLQKNTDYVVNCATGAAPTQIYVENSSLTLANRSWVNFNSTGNAWGTNFLLHVTGGSVASNFTSALSIPTGGRIVVDDGSTLRLKNVPHEVSRATATGTSMAITNSTLFMAGDMRIYGFSNTVTLCNSCLTGNQTVQLYGIGNRLVVSGDCGTTPISLGIFTGTNNWIVLEDGARFASTPSAKLQCSTKVKEPFGYHIGRNAFLFLGYTGLIPPSAGTSNGWVIVESGGELSVNNAAGQEGSLSGYNIRLNDGTFSCSNNMMQVGNNSNHWGTRLELNGDDANVFGMNLTIGNAASTTNTIITLNPGAGAYGGRAPIWSKRAVTFNGPCVFKIDLRAPLRARAANEILRLPVVQAAVDVSGSTFTLSAENLAKLNEQLVTRPPGGRLELDGKVLYCVMKRKATTMLSLR